MPVHAIAPDYTGNVRDRVENFNGQQVVYICWERHLLFSYPFALLVPADMLFSEFRDQVLGEAFSAHPEWSQIDWSTVTWTQGGKVIEPSPSQTLEEQGIHHKASLRFSTPGLNGIYGQSL
ncbi:phenol hydroxylase P4 protein [Marinobacterium sp. MBR-111]|jgi:phenol hydroxylase P4 protein|uniref:phenol hydroxylase subunit P4 n=1 Tax=Marinobacterium sp. MBR-111 TaxID=3156463 RepID=UPI003394B981